MTEPGQRGFQVDEPVRYMDGWIAADAIMVHPKGRSAFETAKAFEGCTDELANPSVIQVCIGISGVHQIPACGIRGK